MRRNTGITVCTLSVAILVVMLFVGAEYTSLLVTALVGFLSMTIGGLVAIRLTGLSTSKRVVSYGLGSGMMLSSATVILAPKAMSMDPMYSGSLGGIGIAIGYVIGYSSHEIGHISTHSSKISKRIYSIKIAEITAHSILSGVLLGIAYGSIPSLSLAFGLGIVAHKLPAGITTTLAARDNMPFLILIPASMVGVVAVPSAYLVQSIPQVISSVVFGVSTGLFIHVAIDMTPTCVASDSEHYSGHGHIVCSENADRQRLVASLSVLAGAIALFGLWGIGRF